MKNNELTLSDRVDLVLKASLDFNSMMLHLHTNFSGAPLDKRDFKKYMRHVKDAEKNYTTQVKWLTEDEDEK